MKIQFEVSPDNVIEFAEALTENDMENRIIGTSEDDNLLIDVHYTKADRDVISQLEDLSETDADDE